MNRRFTISLFALCILAPVVLAEETMVEVTVVEAQIKVTENGVSRVIEIVPKGTRLWYQKVNGEFYSVIAPTKRKAGWIWNKHVLPVQHPEAHIALNAEALKNYQEALKLKAAGNFTAAEPLFRRALELSEQVFGDDHPFTAGYLTHLGDIMVKQGRLREAEPLFVRAEKIYASTMGPEDKETAYVSSYVQQIRNAIDQNIGSTAPNAANSTPANKAGVMLEVLGLDAELTVFEDGRMKPLSTIPSGTRIWSFGKVDTNYNVRDPKSATSSWIWSGAVREIRASDEEAAKIEESKLTIQQLAKAGRLDEAIKHSTQTLGLLQKVYGDGHPFVAQTLSQHAKLHISDGRPEAAAESLQQAIDITKSAIGADNADFVEMLTTLVSVCEELGDFERAAQTQSQKVAVYLKLFGASSQLFADTIADWASLLGKTKNLETAESLFKQAIEIYEMNPDEKPRSYANCVNNLSNFYERQGDFSQAEPSRIKALALCAKQFGEDAPEYVNVLINLGNMYLGMGDLESAEPHCVRAVALSKRVFGERHLGYAGSLNNLGLLYKKKEDYARAIPLLVETCEIAKSIAGEQDDRYLTALTNLGLIYEVTSDYKNLEPILVDMLRIRESVLGPDHTEVAQRLNSLGAFYLVQEKFPAAAARFERALKISEKQWGPDHRLTATCLNNLAVVYRELGKRDAAESMFQRALNIRETVLDPGHAEIASTLTNLANLYEEQGKYALSESFQKRALKIREEYDGADGVETAESLSSLASAYQSQGNYAAAMPLLQRALKVTEDVLGPEHMSTARCLNNLSTFYSAQGNHAAAESHAKRSVAICEKVLGPDHPKTSVSLSTLAYVYSDQGKLDAAERLLQRVLKIRENSIGPDHLDTALALNNLAMFELNQGNYAAVEPLLSRAIAIYDKALGSDHPKTAEILANAATYMFAAKGDYPVALELTARAFSIHEKTLGPNHPATLDNVIALARMSAFLSDVTEAAKWTDRYRRGSREHVGRVLPALPEREQTLFLNADYVRNLHFSLSMGHAHSSNKELVNMSAEWLINGKGITQEALAQRNLLARDISDPALEPIVEKLLAVREKIATAAMTTVSPEDSAARQAKLNSLSASELELAQQLASAGGAKTHSVDWIERKQVQGAIPAGQVFIDIARFKVYNFAAVKAENRWKAARYVAWITSSTEGEDSILVDLGDAAEIEAAIHAVRNGFNNAALQIETNGEERASVLAASNLQTLANKIWQPLQPHVGDAEEIILSPDGALWLVPWNALPLDGNNDQFLLEQYTLRLVVSGRDLVTLPGQFATRPPVILADPKFDQLAGEKRSSIESIFKAVVPRDDTKTRSYSARSVLPNVLPLPNTGLEAAAIRPNLEKYAGQESLLYKEQYALERVVKALRRPKLVSFATHGFFLPTQEINANEQERSDSGLSRSVSLNVREQQIENPLLRCGLLLSGCNNRDSVVGDDDGILTGLEIVGIDFRGTELVVLSACETGIGEIRNGEGVAGLRQAFQLAGAQSVVASLWQVPDRDSAVIMSDFFANLANGQSRADALRNAQIKRIESRRERFGAAHPFYWAAWTLTGQ